jgi:Uncharacterized alpha/beta hydrolase domain (DUF2235)
MGKSIVQCSDGTDNTFREKTINVSRMIFYLDLSDAGKQVVVYDQGIGTFPKRISRDDLKALARHYFSLLTGGCQTGGCPETSTASRTAQCARRYRRAMRNSAYFSTGPH